MANDLNQKYTIERYCTKNEVAKAIGTNLIEPLWRDIAEFRKRLAVPVPFFDTTQTKFSLTYIDSIQARNGKIGTEISSYINNSSKLREGSIAKFTFGREMLMKSLRYISQINKLDASDIVLANVVEDKEVDEKYNILINYKTALYEIYSHPFEEIDEGFLAKYYGILKDEQELLSFYRNYDVESSASRFLVARDYDKGVPARFIEDMMNPVFEYINNSSISLACRISAIFFMFNFIKPFDKFNLEIACLLAKRVLATTEIKSSSIYIPIESIVVDELLLGPINQEVKKTHDFTYAVIRCADLVNEAFAIANDKILKVHAHDLKVEVNFGDDPIKVKEEFGIKLETKKPSLEPVITKKQIQERLESNVQEPAKNLSEKELKAKAKDMLESDPFLKKSQANFYVHHCVKGKYYTIQQYVKFEHCVYETGRTAMDSLAKLGYYKREQIKNKFVYTPIDKE